MKSASFLSKSLEESFNLKGFIHIPEFLSTDELNALRVLFNQCYNFNGEEQGMWNSFYNIPADLSSDVSHKYSKY
jgi:hypothetical protein